MKLKTRLIFSMGSLIIVGFITLILILSIQFASVLQTFMYKNADDLALRYSGEFSLTINTALVQAKAVADTSASLMGGKTARMNIINAMELALDRNPEFGGVWVIFETDVLDGYDARWEGTIGSGQGGRFIPYWNTLSGSKVFEVCMDYDAEGDSSKYYKEPLNTKKPYITKPTTYEIAGKPITVVSVCVPIFNKENVVVGVAGIDLSMDTMKELAASIKPYETGSAYVLYDDATIIAHNDKTKIGKAFNTEVNAKIASDIVKSVAKKAESRLTYKDDKGAEFLQIFVPINFIKSSQTWILALSVPMKVISQPLQDLILVAIIISLITLTISIGISVLIALSLTKPILLISDISKQIANGELGLEIKPSLLLRKDEVGILANSMYETILKLREVVRDVHTASASVNIGTGNLYISAQEMSTGVSGISSSSQQLSQGATEQASSAEEVSASVEEMTANIKQNADNAFQTERIAMKAAEDAKEGSVAVKETVEAMRSIAEKIAIIEEIARQTNMLSLNASIEAARAGEHGKGFAVVASEVGKLAERSKTAAKEISDLSRSSVAIAERAGNQLAKIVPDIQKTAELVQEISAASREQDTGAQQINKAITQLDTVIQHNASLSEEFSATSEQIAGQASNVAETAAQLTGQSEKLTAIIDFFKFKGKAFMSKEELANGAKEQKTQKGTEKEPKKLLAKAEGLLTTSKPERRSSDRGITKEVNIPKTSITISSKSPDKIDNDFETF